MRVITWNIQWGRGADGAVNLSRMVETLCQLGDFDVICLQEVATRFPGLAGGHEEDGLACMRAAFPEYTLIDAPGVDRPHPAGGRSRFGNVLLSRLPVGAVAVHRLPWPPVSDSPSMPRTAIEAVVTLPGDTPMRIVTTHLEYYAHPQRLAQVAYLRQMQADALARSTQRVHPKDASGPFAQPVWPAAAIACGDFNFKPRSRDWKQMIATRETPPLWLDAWAVLNPDRPHPPSVGLMGAEWPDHPYCCDFFFVSEALRGALTAVHYDAGSDASDHQPVMLEIDEAALRSA